MAAKPLNFCKYYKGEDDCPGGDYETFQRWWWLERNYCAASPERRKYWQTRGVEMCLDSMPELKAFITGCGRTLDEKGMLACAIILQKENCAMSNFDFIYDYGKK